MTEQPRILVMPPNDLRAWTFAEPYFREAIVHSDEWLIEDVRDQYCAGKVGVVLALNSEGKVIGAFCVEMAVYPRKKVMQVHLFGADKNTEDDWMNHAWPQLQEFAREHGCDSAVGTGRDGWARKLHAKRRIFWEVPL